MFDDLEAQFFENVLTAHQAFVQSLKSDTTGQNRDLRLAKDAALALFHLREHVPWAKGRDWPPFLEACPEYALLQDIVNVFKHGPRREGQIASPTDIYEVTVMTEYEDAEGRYQHCDKEVTIELRDGSLRDMKAILASVLEMWITEFKTRGLLQRLDPPKPVQPTISTRAMTSGAASLNLTALQGVRFSRSFRRQKYNYATGQIEPIDITGHEYRFSIYEPLVATIVMTNDETGQRFEGTVELSAEETDQYRGLQTDEERGTFLATLAPKYARQLLGQAVRDDKTLR